MKKIKIYYLIGQTGKFDHKIHYTSFNKKSIELRKRLFEKTYNKKFKIISLEK